MKTLKFTFTLLVAIFFASCTTTKISYEEYLTRQAEPVMLNPYITPIVADLDVSQTKETVTETFENKLDIKSKFSNKEIEAWKEVTLAKMMREFNSDVIVAPTYNVSTSKDYKDIIVEISGFPAKYTNFRNISVADSAAMRAHAIEIARHGITDFKNIKSINNKTIKNTTENIEKMSRLGKFFALEASANLGFIDGSDLMLDIQGTYGVQFNKYFGIGGGTGIFTRGEFENMSIPLFVNIRGYFSDSGITPYYSIDFGYMFNIRKDKWSNTFEKYSYDYDEHINYTQRNSLAYKGFTFSPEIGIALGKFNLGLEWKFYKYYTSTTYDFDVNNIYWENHNVVKNDIRDEFKLYDKETKDKARTWFLKVGFTF